MLLQMMMICPESSSFSDEGLFASCIQVVICPMGFLCPELDVAEPAYEMYIAIKENIPAAGWRDNYYQIIFFLSILT